MLNLLTYGLTMLSVPQTAQRQTVARFAKELEKMWKVVAVA
jgi:hypothetical protein